MQQESLSLLAFQKRFRTEKACQKHLFELRLAPGVSVPSLPTRTSLTFIGRVIYMPAKLVVTRPR